MKTCDELECEWGDSISPLSCKKYIYDYMIEQLKKERNKAIDECIEVLSSTTEVSRLLESLKK